MILLKNLQWRIGHSLYLRRHLSSKKIRNIGILAHIDAGKTTTTERMLFYAGKTRALGEVHRGNTVTDYLAQERERGITICSSAVTFPWGATKINLLDTPGHIDFTMEVEQSLHAVDGVVVVLDGTAGVEAQTMTVWAQAEKQRLPKLVFVNKMDRPDADFEKCVDDLKRKLEAHPICLQYPHKDEKGNLSIYDIVTLRHFKWNTASLGRDYKSLKIEDNSLLLELNEKRNILIDQLSGIDDELATVIINNNDGFSSVSNELISRALRRATCQRKLVPVCMGSAYKNVGIQTLLDAVIECMPTPEERNEIYDCFGNDFVGKVFKIVHDKQRGPLTLVRVLRGEMQRGMRLTTTRGTTEVLSKIYEPLADEYREIKEVVAGDVAVCAGLKNTITGDLLMANSNVLKQAQKRLLQSTATNVQPVENLTKELFALEPQIPDAVFFCSVEPPSLASQSAMEMALKQLQREDPSLRVTFDDVTGQTVLGGMGELHMDIIKSRILTEYKIEVELGQLQIAYKETIATPTLHTLNVEKEIAGIKQNVNIKMELLQSQKEIFRYTHVIEFLFASLH